MVNGFIIGAAILYQAFLAQVLIQRMGVAQEAICKKDAKDASVRQAAFCTLLALFAFGFAATLYVIVGFIARL